MNVAFVAQWERIHTLILLAKSVFTSRYSQNELVLGLPTKELEHHIFEQKRFVCVSDSIDHGDCVSIVPLLILNFVHHRNEGSDACSVTNHEYLFWFFLVHNRRSRKLQDTISLTELTFDFNFFVGHKFLISQELGTESFVLFIDLRKALLGEYEL